MAALLKRAGISVSARPIHEAGPSRAEPKFGLWAFNPQPFGLQPHELFNYQSPEWEFPDQNPP